jgi:GNAT superfamily N-acetyltransferase
MNDLISIKVITQDDIAGIVEVLKEPYMLGREDQYISYFNKCHDQNKSGDRITYVAYYEEKVAGYVNIIFRPAYPYFADMNIPEINDLYVVPSCRKKGIGWKLINTCEEYAAKAGFERIGLGVGLYKDYGSAQRLYTKNGYILDGNGLMYENKQVSPGSNVFVDDELLLYLYKELK